MYSTNFFSAEQTTGSTTIRSRMRLQMVSENETRSTFTKLNGKKQNWRDEKQTKKDTRYEKGIGLAGDRICSVLLELVSSLFAMPPHMAKEMKMRALSSI